jgi:hypothetical protein
MREKLVTRKKNEDAVIKFKASDIKLDIQKSEKLTEEEQSKINNVVQENGIVTQDLRTAINKNGIKAILTTDQKAVNRLYNNLDEDDKIENGDEKYIRTPAVIKEICEREENYHNPHTKAILEHSKRALDALSNNSEVENLRQIDKSRKDKQLPQVKQEKIKESMSIDNLTGESIEKGDVHHTERVADNPRKQNDKENLIFTSHKNHSKIHKENAETPKELEQLAKNEGWNYPNTKKNQAKIELETLR